MSSTASIRVGTCGYRYYEKREGADSVLATYSRDFDVGELNRTFYRLPQESTADRWRREARDGFQFSVKAWQAITHPWRSPTWNDYRDTVPDEHTDDVGYCRPTQFVIDAWDRTTTIAAALDAPVILVQTPPSFDATDTNEQNLRQFCEAIDRTDFTVAWEPRGSWLDAPDRIDNLCDDLDLVHVVDLLRSDPRGDASIVYTRLHGLNEDRTNYDYDYDDAELDALAERVTSLADTHETVYCLFNNYEMYDNATRFRERLGLT